MANEITYRGALVFAKGNDAARFDFGDLTANMSGTKWLCGRQTCGTSEEALGLGETAAGSAWVIFRNQDGTNKLLVAPAAGAAYLIEVQPGETAGPFRFLSTVTAPVVKSSASTVDFSYLLVSA